MIALPTLTANIRVSRRLPTARNPEGVLTPFLCLFGPHPPRLLRLERDML